MSQVISDELFNIVHDAARPVAPGEGIKAQMNRAWVALGRPAMWRLKSAWWRDGSGSWSAAAVRDFQERHSRWKHANAQRLAAEEARLALLEKDNLEQARARLAVELAELDARLHAIRRLHDDDH